ncbi:MAG: hypothetical protein V1800_13425 [Candidatus Latescibacterota bacterium]
MDPRILQTWILPWSGSYCAVLPLARDADQALAQGGNDELSPVVDTQFLHGVGDVGFEEAFAFSVSRPYTNR